MVRYGGRARLFSRRLRPVAMTPEADEPCRVIPLKARATSRIHLMTYGGRFADLCREGWDVIHAWEEPYIFAGGQIARRRPKDARLVFASFQNIAKRYPPPFSWIESYALRRSAGWIAFGALVEQTLCDRRGYEDRPRRIIPPGVDVDAFRPDPDRRRATLARLGWNEAGPPVIGFIGRFVPEKGLALLTAVLNSIAAPGECCSSEPGRWKRRYGNSWASTPTACGF